ncbi:glycosyltransferase [Halobacteriovorax sp. RZ-1]|uniref:glycosyltransferase n=1 Tax=unclassified Halobacteriovorax TaxID=2639665 RepID=UPI0037245D9D
MTIYKNDNLEHLKEAIDSILNQTRRPDEFLIVKDGPLLKDTENMLSNISDPIIKYLTIEKNIGQSMALNYGIKECKYELVARMDSDDICDLTRLEKQFEIFSNNPQIDVVGTGIIEFSTSIEDASKIRILPSTSDEIHNFSKFRCPVNHATVMYKRSKVIEAGNYTDIYSVADYLLWVRMMKIGCNFINIPETLLFVRGGSDMYKRRSGFYYAKQEIKLQNIFYKMGHINLFEYIRNTIIRIGSSLSPNFFRGFFYSNFLRTSKKLDAKK